MLVKDGEFVIKFGAGRPPSDVTQTVDDFIDSIETNAQQLEEDMAAKNEELVAVARERIEARQEKAEQRETVFSQFGEENEDTNQVGETSDDPVSEVVEE